MTTHMHFPLGCFGSMITYEPSERVCQACPHHVACGQRVAEIRPIVINLLDKFSDLNGRAMSHAWLTRGERKTRKDTKIEEDIVTAGLVVSDQRTAPLVRRAAREGIEIRTARPDQLEDLSPAMAAAIATLKRGPTTAEEIAANIVERTGAAPTSAARTTRSLIKMLRSHDRLRVTKKVLELL